MTGNLILLVVFMRSSQISGSVGFEIVFAATGIL